MKAEFVNPFVSSAFSVIHAITGDQPKRGQLSARKKLFKSTPVSIVIGVTDGLKGQVLYGMTFETAKSIAGAMLGQGPVPELDELAISALAELGNMITGGASTQLAEAGYRANISPPSVVKGADIVILTVEAALVVPIITQYGTIEINVALQD